MTGPVVGSLCSGAGGLDLAALDVFGGRVAWHAEWEPPVRDRKGCLRETSQAAAKLLAHHWPDVPNHGDITVVDWSAVASVDIITAGWPCQPWSVAGKRRGAIDERAIWPAVATAIRVVRPRIVLLENVPSAVTNWGRYAGAVERWERILGRTAPPPTITGQRGGRKLNPDLTDWMMGWPEGWTDVPGVTVNDRLRLCGNGVVRQQAVAALRWLLGTLR